MRQYTEFHGKAKIDIDLELEHLVMQYKVDRFHPRFSKRRAAIDLLRVFFDGFSEADMVLIARDETDYKYIYHDCLKTEPEVLYYEQIEAEQLKRFSDTNKKIIVISFYGKEEMLSELANCGLKAVSIYDWLAVQGILLECNYYDIFGREYHEFNKDQMTYDFASCDENGIFFFDRRCYESAADRNIREMYLAKMIFDCIWARDFVMADRCMEEYYKNDFRYANEYHAFQEKVTVLLEEIKQMLKKRNREDIFIFWLDALEYGEDQDMPFLKSVAEQGIDFEHAYTVTPYTHSTAKTLLMGKYVIDDKSYELKIDKTASFIKYIEEKGYRFSFYTFLRDVDVEVKGNVCQTIYQPLSAITWNALRDLLLSSKKACVMMHEVVQTHEPYSSFGLLGHEYSYLKTFDGRLSDYGISIRKQQQMESRRYTDTILEFYYDLIPEKAFKIYLSDHGYTAYEKYHTIFRVIQQNLKPQKIHEVFSYIKFEELIELLLKQCSDFRDVLSTHAIVQDVDYYNKESLKLLLSNDNPNLDILFGYNGIVTAKDRYIRRNHGAEEYFNAPGQDRKLTEEREVYLRSLCAEYPQNLIKEEKFKYSRNVYRTLEHYYNRNCEFEKRKREAVRGLFDRISEKRVVAIRGGGIHTMRMWFELTWAQRKKINYMIDQNKNCVASYLGVEVISMDQWQAYGVDTIIVSSFDYEKRWLKELDPYAGALEVIGLYSYLKAKGITCKGPFYREEISREDVVWEE